MDVAAQILFYALALGIVTLTITIFYLTSLYRDLVKKMASTKLAHDLKIKEDIKAQEKIIVEVLSDEVRKKLQRDLATVVSQIRQDLISHAPTLVADLEKNLREVTLSVEEAVRKVAEEEHDKSKKEIEEFKNQQMIAIAAKAKELLPQVLKDVVTQTLDPKTQESLIINSLENAKRQNLF